MNIYPDYNIINALDKGENLMPQILQVLGEENLDFYYSDSHLYETATMSGYNGLTKEEVIKDRLNFINNLTKKRFLSLTKGKKLLFSIRSAEIAFNEIADYPTKEKIAIGFTDIASFAARKLFREFLNIDVGKLNSLSPQDVVSYLNDRYQSAGLPDTFESTLEEGYKQTRQNGILGTYDKIAMIFGLLDMIGYYKDKETDKSDFARMWDADHAHYAANCSAFISKDKRAVKKTEVAYQLLGITTKVILVTLW